MDEAALGCILAGALVLLGVGWALWAIAWLRRVELRDRVEPVIHELGLHWLPEGLWGRVSAAGTCDGKLVELRAEAPARAPRLSLHVGGRWVRLPGVASADAVRTARSYMLRSAINNALAQLIHPKYRC